MKKLSISLVSSVASLWVVSQFVDSMQIDSFSTLVILAIILGLLNTFVKPILKFLSFPITILSLGLFSLVINAAVLKLAFILIPGANLTGFISTIMASILLSISNCIISNVLD